MVYGVSGFQDDVPPSVYDNVYAISDGEVIFQAEVDMGDHQIKNVKDGVDKKDSVNVGQLDASKNSLTPLLNAKQPKSFYNNIFTLYFDLLDPNSFDVDPSASGGVLAGVNSNLVLKTTQILKKFDPKKGFLIQGSHVSLGETVNENEDLTMFVALKHDTKFKSFNYFGFGDNSINASVPAFALKDDGFSLKLSGSYVVATETLLSAFENKFLFFWFCKKGNLVKISGPGYFTTNNTLKSFRAGKFFIGFPYMIQRVGFVKKFYDISSPEFYKILFLEKAAGTFFL